jgi:hypothetical protein
LSSEEKYRRSQERFEQQQQTQQNQNSGVQPSEGGGGGGKPFGREALFSQEKGKRWLVAEIPSPKGHGDKYE